MVGKSECLQCKKEFKWRRSVGIYPKYCSRVCMRSNIKFWSGKNSFRWATASPQEQIERLKEIFEKHVLRDNKCWNWKGKLHKSGYALMIYGKDHKQIGAHRVSWIIHFGEIPEGLYVCHKCDNKKCTNPEHLFLGTPKENTQDMLKKDRKNTPIGEKVFSSKLTSKQVIKIKKMLSLGVTMTKLALKYNVSLSAISDIKKEKTWKHIKSE